MTSNRNLVVTSIPSEFLEQNFEKIEKIHEKTLTERRRKSTYLYHPSEISMSLRKCFLTSSNQKIIKQMAITREGHAAKSTGAVTANPDYRPGIIREDKRKDPGRCHIHVISIHAEP